MMERRDFLRNLGYGFPSFYLLGRLNANPSSAFASESKPKRIDIGALAQSLDEDLKKAGLIGQGWYVDEVDNKSDAAVILIADIPHASQKGIYNPVFDIVSKYVHSVGLEGAENGSQKTLESVLELQKEFLPSGIGNNHVQNSNKLYEHIAKSGKTLFGVEEKGLFKRSLYLTQLRDLVTDLGLVTIKQPQHPYFSAYLSELKKVIQKLEEGVNLEELPRYSEDIFWNHAKYEKYKKGIDALWAKHTVNDRSERAVGYTMDQLMINDGKKHPNIVGLVIFPTDTIKKSFDDLGISYVVVGTKNPNHVLKISSSLN